MFSNYLQGPGARRLRGGRLESGAFGPGLLSECYSLALTALEAASCRTPSRVAVLPEEAGRPRIELTSGSMKNDSSPPQPLAARRRVGAVDEHAAAQGDDGERFVERQFTAGSPSSEPLVPVVNLSWTGFELEPM